MFSSHTCKILADLYPMIVVIILRYYLVIVLYKFTDLKKLSCQQSSFRANIRDLANILLIGHDLSGFAVLMIIS